MVQALGGDAHLVSEKGIDVEQNLSLAASLRSTTAEAARRLWKGVRHAADSARGQA